MIRIAVFARRETFLGTGDIVYTWFPVPRSPFVKFILIRRRDPERFPMPPDDAININKREIKLAHLSHAPVGRAIE